MIYPLLFGNFGMSEILVLLLLVILFFGGKKIPELMRGMGRGVKEFKDAMNEESSKEEKKTSDKSDSEQKE